MKAFKYLLLKKEKPSKIKIHLCFDSEFSKSCFERNSEIERNSENCMFFSQMKKKRFLNFKIMQSEKKEILATAVGRRKEAVAQVQLVRGTGEFHINNKPAPVYLNNNACSLLALKEPFQVFENEAFPEANQIDTIVKVQGGGLIGQAEAMKLGIARAICQIENIDEENLPMLKKSLKDKGCLTVDARVKERRKYGLKKARKASQYHKR
jgi:small subunit ribosomal protein S9